MEEQVREQLLSLVEAVILAIQRSDSYTISKLSDDAIHLFTTSEEKNVLQFAVVTYALSKLLSRAGYDEVTVHTVLDMLAEAKSHLESSEDERYADEVKDILENLAKTDQKFKLFIDHVVESAQAKKGLGMHEQGYSIARSAELLGVTQWDLMNYVGKTQIPEKEKHPGKVRDRLNYTRTLFS